MRNVGVIESMAMIDPPKARLQDPINGRFAKGNVGGAPQRKLTAERHKAIVGHVGDGNYLSTSARAAGVHGRTLTKWLKRGEADHAAGRRSTFRSLYLDVRRAVSENEARLVSVINTAGVTGFKVQRVHRRKDAQGKVVQDEEITTVPPDWRAARSLLDARHQSRFGNKHQLEVGGRIAHLHVPVPEMTAEDEAIAIRICQRRMDPDHLLPPAVDGAPG